ncbi:MAG: hypothetical protein ACJ79K_09710 [Gemmatimonadaceae bacterium]
MRSKLVALIVAGACSAPAATDGHAHDVHLSLSRVSGSALLPQPYVSIVDSMALTVTAEDGTVARRGAHLSRRDTTTSFELKVREGSTRFDVAVLSNNGTTVLSGTSVVKVDHDDFPVDIVPTAQTPIMAVAPDSVTVVIPLPRSGRTTFQLYNRGLGASMIVQVVDTSSGHAQCAPRRCFVPLRILDTVPAGKPFLAIVDTILRFNNPITLRFKTAQGVADVVIRTQ